MLSLEEWKMKTYQIDAHLYIGNSIFVLMNRKIGLWNWKRKSFKTKVYTISLQNEWAVYHACLSHRCYFSATLYKKLSIHETTTIAALVLLYRLAPCFLILMYPYHLQVISIPHTYLSIMRILLGFFISLSRTIYFLCSI